MIDPQRALCFDALLQMTRSLVLIITEDYSRLRNHSYTGPDFSSYGYDLPLSC